MATAEIVRPHSSGRQTSRPPMVFCYCRVSHLDSADSGLGIDAQLELFERHWKAWLISEKFQPQNRGVGGWEGGYKSRVDGSRRIVSRVGEPRTDGIWVDLSVSAYKKSLRLRPAGSLLDKTLRSGDTVVFPKLDRAFRNQRDYGNTLSDWSGRGISIIFLKPDISLDSAMGRLMGQMFASIAEFESAIKSERTREALHMAWVQGKPANPRVLRVFGFRKDPTNRKWIPYWGERALLHEIVVCGREQGMTWNEIREQMEIRMAALERREVRPQKRDTPQFDKRKPRPVSDYTNENLTNWYKRWVILKHLFPLFPKDAIE